MTNADLPREQGDPNVQEKRRLAVFTIVQDEPEFIHPWVRHYRKHVVDPSDIFVLVHSIAEAGREPALLSAWRRARRMMTSRHGVPFGPASGWHRAQSLMALRHGVTVVPVHHASSFDHRWLLGTVGNFYRFLLQSYAWVMFAEIDEFIQPTPTGKYAGLALSEVVQRLDGEAPQAVRATGFEIVHQLDDEVPLDPRLYRDGDNVALSARTLIQDRHMWYQSDRYSKTLLANTPLKWERGFHTVTEAPNDILNLRPSEDLLLLHLHKVDFDLALGRSRRAFARRWSKIDVEQRIATQNP